MKPSDAHCHLYFDQFDQDREEVLERAREELELVGVAGCDPETNRETMELCQGNELLVPCLGLHPTFTEAFSRLEEVENQIGEEDPAAVGEIGLDHHHVQEAEMRDQQLEVFRSMLELAEDLDLPAVVHSRDAERSAFEEVQQFDTRAFFHCFNGPPELAEEIARESHLVGVTTQVLYSSRVQEIAERIPLENLVTETDSPFLYPDGRNEPVKVKEAVEKVAEIRDLEAEEVSEAATGNALEFFCR